MADGLKEIIRRLEQQRAAIERALAALKEVDGVASVSSPAAAESSEASRPATKKGRRKGGITAEGRRRLSESLRARWAAKRAGGAGPATKKSTGKKRGRKPKSAM